MIRLWLGMALCAGLLACADGESRAPPGELEILEAANTELGLNVPKLEDESLLEEFADQVIRKWYESEHRRMHVVTVNGWKARVQRSGLSVHEGARVLSRSSTVVGVSSSAGNETSIRTIEVVVWSD